MTMRVYHGTSDRITALRIGSFVPTDVALAARYALRHPTPVVLERDAVVARPPEPAYASEYVIAGPATMDARHVPRFRTWPDDFYELADDRSDDKDPALFDPEQWQRRIVRS